jgi:hypothetical protein|tara:strand:- start:406 stop:570 length:165 start_codon:yes stop_codon:yes gene_type:complete
MAQKKAAAFTALQIITESIKKIGQAIFGANSNTRNLHATPTITNLKHGVTIARF